MKIVGPFLSVEHADTFSSCAVSLTLSFIGREWSTTAPGFRNVIVGVEITRSMHARLRSRDESSIGLHA
jgi:hypothetical protein